MAGGIEWFRWHHGCAYDPKFGLVASKAGARVSEVLSVWACLLEAASADEERGHIGAIDFDSMDFALGMDEGTAERIYARMCDRGLVDADANRITAWDKRQPKRERDDAGSSTNRVQAHRERLRLLAAGGETPRNASASQETPREEESREEESINTSQPPGGGCVSATVDSNGPKAKRASLPDCPHQRILALWAEVLPAMPQHNPDMWDGARAHNLRQRWRETAQRCGWKAQEEGLEYFRRLFVYIGTSTFLTGRSKPREPGREPFIADLEFIVTVSKWRRLHEGKYQDAVEVLE